MFCFPDMFIYPFKALVNQRQLLRPCLDKPPKVVACLESLLALDQYLAQMQQQLVQVWVLGQAVAYLDSQVQGYVKHHILFVVKHSAFFEVVVIGQRS